MSKLLKKPKITDQIKEVGRFERFGLKENPFPSQPFVNKDADDNRINGKIFEMEIRIKEYEQIQEHYLKIPQDNPSHLRLGYIIDTSYVGRGNGKSAFLVNLLEKINTNYCIDISDGSNKCFAIYMAPEPGGMTKSFDRFINLMFDSIYKSDIIKNSLATLKLQSLINLNKNFKVTEYFKNDSEIIENLDTEEWFDTNRININELMEDILKNENLKTLPSEFPLYSNLNTFIIYRKIVTQKQFLDYFQQLKRSSEKLSFIFSDLVNLFRAANFNGSYVLVDDYERIPDFQSARQKRDFALQLRTCLFDGLYTSSKIGFYNFLLVLHAGVPRLIQEAWSESGMEHRAPISPKQSFSNHIIPFEKLTMDHAKLLIKKYLDEFRLSDKNRNNLFPFEEDAVKRIAELSELNASKILKMAYELLDKAAETKDRKIIDVQFISSLDKDVFEDKPPKSIASTDTIDLEKKAKEKE